MPDTLIARAASAPSSESAASSDSWDGDLTALESRADVDSLYDLQQRRRKLIEDNAHLLALYGSFGLFDDRRKQMLEAQKVAARMNLTQQGAKVTEGMVEAEAYGSAAYQTLLDRAIEDKIACIKVQNAIDELNERIKNRESALFVYGQEVRLGH